MVAEPVAPEKLDQQDALFAVLRLSPDFSEYLAVRLSGRRVDLRLALVVNSLVFLRVKEPLVEVTIGLLGLRVPHRLDVICWVLDAARFLFFGKRSIIRHSLN